MNWVLRICAGIIDLLQFIFFVVFLAFQAMTPIGGAAAGGVTGAVICWKMSTGVVEGLINGAACAAGGGALGGVISAIAVPLGMAIDVAISATFGVLLILLLFVTGRFSFMAVAMGFTAEMMPGLNGFVPGWSILVHRCIQQHKLKEQGVGIAGRTALGLMGSVASVIPGAGIATTALKPAVAVASYAAQAASPRDAGSRTPLKNFDGIRAANDNTPRTIYAKAA